MDLMTQHLIYECEEEIFLEDDEDEYLMNIVSRGESELDPPETSEDDEEFDDLEDIYNKYNDSDDFNFDDDLDFEDTPAQYIDNNENRLPFSDIPDDYGDEDDFFF